MAPALTDGVPGVEAIHTLTPPSPFSTIALNDWMDPSTGNTYQWGTKTAYSWLTDIQGLHDRPDSDDPRLSLVFQHGELPLPRYGRGRSITYTGLVAGQTMSALRAKVAAIRAAVTNGLTTPTAWLISVAYNSTYDSSGLAFTGYGVPVGFTCDDNQPSPQTAPSPYVRQFVLTFRQSDGRWWVTPNSFLCTVGSSGSPINSGSSGTLTLTGTAPSEPIITVKGTGAGAATISLSGSQSGGTMAVDLPSALASGDKLVIDFSQRLITYLPSGGGSHDYTGYIDWSNTNWWVEPTSATPLVIGANTITVTGDHWYATSVPACW